MFFREPNGQHTIPIKLINFPSLPGKNLMILIKKV